MSFLLGDDYASSSSESESEEEAVTTPTPLKAAGEAVVQLLPSADSVLSSVAASTASFLAPQAAAKQQSAVESFDLLKEREAQRREQEKKERSEREAARGADSRKSDRKRPPPPQDATANKREKKDAKERVKNQRVKGQAGIGSDFRSWKSETEMSLRQQFD